MIRKDYIQRYFDELAKVLAVVLQLKNDLKPIEAESKLDEFCADYLAINFQEILSINKNDFITHLIEKKEFTITHFKLLEDLLYYKYLLNPSDKKLKSITLEILNYLTENDTDFSFDRMNRIDELSF